MKLQITQKLKNKDIKVLISNFSYMSIIEISNYILPFIVIPYIVRTIGVEKFGIIMFAYAVMAFFEIIANWGFKLLAPKFISINRDNTLKLSKYFWSVFFTQLILLVISFFIFSLLLLFNIDKINQEKTVFFYAFLMMAGKVLFPIWFFQGIEEMKFIAIFNFTSRVIYTLIVFIMVNEGSDYVLLPLVNAFSYILVFLFSFYYIHKKFNILFYSPSFIDIKTHLVEGKHLFLSSISNTLYTSLNIVLLGLLAGYGTVGIISIATTISGAVVNIIRIYSSVTFPYLAKFTNNKATFIQKTKALLKVYSLLVFLASIITFFSADFIIPLIFGPGKDESIHLLKILAISVAFQPFGAFFTSYLVLKNQSKTVSKITFYTMLVNFILIIPAIYYYNSTGAVAVYGIVALFQVLINSWHNKELFFAEKVT